MTSTSTTFEPKLIRRNATKMLRNIFDSITSAKCYSDLNKYVGQDVENLGCIEKDYQSGYGQLHQLSEYEYHLKVHSSLWYSFSTAPKIEQVKAKVEAEPAQPKNDTEPEKVNPVAKPVNTDMPTRTEIKLLATNKSSIKEISESIISASWFAESNQYTGEEMPCLNEIKEYCRDHDKKRSQKIKQITEHLYYLIPCFGDGWFKFSVAEPKHQEAVLNRIDELRKEVDQKYLEIQSHLDEINTLKAQLKTTEQNDIDW